MLMGKLLINIILMILVTLPARSDTFLISLFNEHSLSAIVVSADRGTYRLVADGNDEGVYGENDILYITMHGDSLLIRNQSGRIGVCSAASFNEIDEFSVFSLRPADPVTERSFYFGSLDISVEFGRLRIINRVDEHNYLAGVVEAEAGTGWPRMFYRVQAIISRTYLYGNISRHADEGFHLCDDVHCQVYKGRLSGNETIYEAVSLTDRLVIVTEDNSLITAAYHSNCGGQTVNSEDVWLVHRPYLRSVNDPYCLNSRNAVWEAGINTDKWADYLRRMGFAMVAAKPDPQLFAFRQQVRRSFYNIGDVSIPFRILRNDWGLRSAWFDIRVANPSDRLLIRGRGHGHGVGLCQEGAMEMAARGYNFIDILQFYYTGVKIKRYEDLF